MANTYQARVNEGCRWGLPHPDYIPKKPTGNPGPYAEAGEIVTVSEQELRDFGDKITLLDPMSAVLSKPNGATPAGVDETDRQQVVADLLAANDSLQAELAKAREHALKSEQSARRARATLKSERKKNQAVEAPDKSASDQAKVEA